MPPLYNIALSQYGKIIFHLTLKNKITILEGYHLDKIKIQLTKCNLQNINTIQPHKDWIRAVSTFPSGNIISVSKDQSIKIYDINFDIIQCIENAHDDFISYVDINLSASFSFNFKKK